LSLSAVWPAQPHDVGTCSDDDATASEILVLADNDGAFLKGAGSDRGVALVGEATILNVFGIVTDAHQPAGHGGR
jgi:hypothetical protein